MRVHSVILAALAMASGPVFATPVTWTFQDVYFDDGAQLTGSFVFDVDSEAVVILPYHPLPGGAYFQPFYFDIDIATGDPQEPQSPDNGLFFSSPGNYSADYHGEYLDSVFNFDTDENNPPPPPDADPSAYQTGFVLGATPRCGPFGEPCDLRLVLNFDQPLTNAGGTVALSGYEAASVFLSPNYIENSRSIVSGTLVANVVPIPAAVWLFASALAGLGWVRRRRT